MSNNKLTALEMAAAYGESFTALLLQRGLGRLKPEDALELAQSMPDKDEGGTMDPKLKYQLYRLVIKTLAAEVHRLRKEQ